MISAKQALDIILSHRWMPPVEHVDIRMAVSRVLAKPLRADRDLPPYDRVTMDGIAIAFDAFKSGQRNFQVEGLQPAGEPPQALKDKRKAIEVMTGAVLPTGADTVIRYEDIKISSHTVVLDTESIKQGQSIHRKGSDAREGDLLLDAGTRLSPAEIALLASVGQSTVSVWGVPRVAVISTGPELVPIDVVPQPHQVRRSNTYAIDAALVAWNIRPHHFHFPDDEAVLEEALAKLLNDFDMLVLSGGVSKGKFDFIPAVLKKLSVAAKFHEVSQRPGKPFWFGIGARGQAVFALPGNPVSTFLCFCRYVEPWLRSVFHQPLENQWAALTEDFSFEPPLTYFLPVALSNREGVLSASPSPGGGSGDFANLKNVDGFLELPPDRSVFQKGEAFPLIAFRHWKIV